MCDYSLEQYRSRPARTGEQYVTHRFRTGSVGIISPDDRETAVCMPCDARLRIEDVPAHLKTSFGLEMPAEAVFVEQPRGSYRDGVAFQNGTRLSLQELGPDVRLSVIHLLDDKATTQAAAEPVEA